MATTETIVDRHPWEVASPGDVVHGVRFRAWQNGREVYSNLTLQALKPTGVLFGKQAGGRRVVAEYAGRWRVVSVRVVDDMAVITVQSVA